MNEPGVVFDEIMKTDEIIQRATSVSEHYDELIKYSQAYLLHGEGKHEFNSEKLDVSLYGLKRLLYLTIMSVNILEAIRFYVSLLVHLPLLREKLWKVMQKLSN